MKKLLTLIAIALAVMVSSCSKFDDAAIWEKFEEQEQILNDHEKRIAALEELCKQMNTNISALQTLVEALEKNDYITNVSPITKDGIIIGYTITFVKSGTITIYNGEDGKNGTDGKDGYTPQIGVKQASDGLYYWTVDGEWLLDEDGNKIRTTGDDGKDGVGSGNGDDGIDGKNGITPRLKIENDYWYVSYDEGTTWTKLGKATGEDGISPRLKIENDYWYVSYDEGVTWVRLCKAVGNGGDGSNNVGNGEDGITPRLKIENGYWYVSYDDGETWTKLGKATGEDGVNGKDGEDGVDGKDGITPRLKIENDYWYVSYDDGATWIELGKATGEDGMDGSDGSDGADGDNMLDGIFTSITQDDECVYFNLADGTMITLPKHDKENIQFEDLQVKAICCKNWDTNNDGELSYAEAAAVTDVGTVFNGNTNIIAFTELRYFTGLTTIASSAFDGCSNLWKIVIPDGVEKIGYQAFENCKTLHRINIPCSLRHIGSHAFCNCNNLTGVYITDLASFLTITLDGVRNGYPLYNAGNLYLNNEIITDLIIPTSISEVLEGALYGCTSIESVTLHSNISSIGRVAFGECSNLSTIYCIANTPPKIWAYDDSRYSFPREGDYTIYVPQESYETYIRISETSSDGSIGNWYRYKSKIKPYDFENNVEAEL